MKDFLWVNCLGLSAAKLSAGQAIHEAKIIVNEEGTEAAAATAISISTRTNHQPESQPESFVANKPFLFAIHHKSAGFLFIGKYLKPEVVE